MQIYKYYSNKFNVHSNCNSVILVLIYKSCTYTYRFALKYRSDSHSVFTYEIPNGSKMNKNNDYNFVNRFRFQFKKIKVFQNIWLIENAIFYILTKEGSYFTTMQVIFLWTSKIDLKVLRYKKNRSSCTSIWNILKIFLVSSLVELQMWTIKLKIKIKYSFVPAHSIFFLKKVHYFKQVGNLFG